MLDEGARCFDRFLLGDTARPLSPPVAISPERWRGTPRRYASLPKVVDANCVGSDLSPCSGFAFAALPRPSTIAQAGRVRLPSLRLGRPTEVFGAPTVEVKARAAGGWSRIVAVLSARTPDGREIVVAGGGVPTTTGLRTYRIVLGDQATFLPKGSRLFVTIGSSSLAQSPGNLLYLDLPFPSTARLAVSGFGLRLPVLATPISG